MTGHAKGDELARKYARAAYEHTTQNWLSTLNAVRDRLASLPDLLPDLNNTEASFAERRARLDALLPPGVQSDLQNFLHLLLREGHLGMLDGIVASLTQLATRGPAAETAYITSAVPLTSREKEDFYKWIRGRFGADVDLDFRVDPSVLGGVTVQVGDKVIDGSLSSKLDALHDRLAALR